MALEIEAFKKIHLYIDAYRARSMSNSSDMDFPILPDGETSILTNSSVCWFQPYNLTEAGIYFFGLTSSLPLYQQIPFAEANFLIPSL
ncbi:hypothetical protein J7J00_25010 [Bacillus sp. ISL-4]|nr:hypothetical protein [Bacillus sp. ISL-4]